jgi:transcriptional regulator with XRE-family HTH domain
MRRLDLRHLVLLELYYSVQLALRSCSLEAVAHEAGCSPSTLYHWREGITIAPRINTLTRVAQVLGYEITWSRH